LHQHQHDTTQKHCVLVIDTKNIASTST